MYLFILYLKDMFNSKMLYSVCRFVFFENASPLLTFIPVGKISLKICEVFSNATLALYCTTQCLLSTVTSRT